MKVTELKSIIREVIEESKRAQALSLVEEGQFSWYTQDTGEPIYSTEGYKQTVYMVAPDGTIYEEPDYDGYGVFGGKDYYELLAELNGCDSRDEGIDLAYSGRKDIIHPALVTDPSHATDDKFAEGPESHENQGWYIEDESDEEDEDYNTDYDEDDEEGDSMYEEGWLQSLAYGAGQLMEKAANPADIVKKMAEGFNKNYKRLAAKLKDVKTKQTYYDKQFDKDLTDLIKIASEVKNYQIDGEKLANSKFDSSILVATIAQCTELFNALSLQLKNQAE